MVYIREPEDDKCSGGTQEDGRVDGWKTPARWVGWIVEAPPPCWAASASAVVKIKRKEGSV